MVELHELQEGAPAVVADQSSAGYSGSTQFVDLNSLEMGTVGEQPGVPEVGQVGQVGPTQDPLLQQSYQFTPDAVQQYGEATLIFARNQSGQEVVLKRVWQGHPPIRCPSRSGSRSPSRPRSSTTCWPG